MAAQDIEMLINIDAKPSQQNNDVVSDINDDSDSDGSYELEDVAMLELVPHDENSFHDTPSIMVNTVDSIFYQYVIPGDNEMDLVGWMRMRGYLAECAALCWYVIFKIFDIFSLHPRVTKNTKHASMIDLSSSQYCKLFTPFSTSIIYCPNSTARSLREPAHWAGRGTVLHVLCAHDPPYFLIDLILQIQDCKNYPLGTYMVTDLDSNGNCPLHLAFQNRCSSDAVVHMLVHSDPDCLVVENAQNMTPLDLLLKRALSLSCPIAFRQLDMMRHVCFLLYLESLFKLIQTYHQVGCREGENGHGNQNALSALLRHGNWPTPLISDALNSNFSGIMPPSCLTDIDAESGMYPFMLAAMGKSNQVSTVFMLLRMAPQVVSKVSYDHFL